MSRGDLVVSRWGLRFAGRRFPAAIGRGGIRAAKREGDGASPAGRHRIMGMLYRPGRVPRADLPAWARPIGPFARWSDDPADPAYNHQIPHAEGYSSERLARPDPLYDLVLFTDYNWPEAVPGRGSAIFLHIWRKPRHPTEGCIALRRDHLLWVAARVPLKARLIIG